MDKTDKFTTEELRELFGDDLPIEVAAKLFYADPEINIGELREWVREYASSYIPKPKR